MGKISTSLVMLIPSLLFSQQLIRLGEFPPRDFFWSDNTLVCIEKQHVVIADENLKESYFIGGYGLKIFDNPEDNKIISISNEERQAVCSVRFYDKSTQKTKEVLNRKNGRALDALYIKKQNRIVLSLTDKKIVLLDYSKRPQLIVDDELTIDSMCRRMSYHDNHIYYGTDSGGFFKYNILTKRTEKLFKAQNSITDFRILDDILVYMTIDGNIVKRNLVDETEIKIHLDDNFVLVNHLTKKNKIFLGTFTGDILVLNPTNMSIENKISHHKKPILKITEHNGAFYSSSLDRTLKKWSF